MFIFHICGLMNKSSLLYEALLHCILRYSNVLSTLLGRYNKYSRELSQTPWFIDGVRKTETSVQVNSN